MAGNGTSGRVSAAIVGRRGGEEWGEPRKQKEVSGYFRCDRRIRRDQVQRRWRELPGGDHVRKHGGSEQGDHSGKKKDHKKRSWLNQLRIFFDRLPYNVLHMITDMAVGVLVQLIRIDRLPTFDDNMDLLDLRDHIF